MIRFLGVLSQQRILLAGFIILCSLGINCSSDAPQIRTFYISIVDGHLESETSNLEVNQRDHVNIIVNSDQDVLFHLHGYDIETFVKAGEPSKLSFLAKGTGSFPFSVHVYELGLSPISGLNHEQANEDDHHSGKSHVFQGDLKTSEGERELGRLEVSPN